MGKKFTKPVKNPVQPKNPYAVPAKQRKGGAHKLDEDKRRQQKEQKMIDEHLENLFDNCECDKCYYGGKH
jgi:hypothetical protein